MGVPADTVAEQRLLPSVHQVDRPQEGNLQTARLEGRFATVGTTEEQARDELRDDGQSAQVFTQWLLLLLLPHPN